MVYNVFLKKWPKKCDVFENSGTNIIGAKRKGA